MEDEILQLGEGMCFGEWAVLYNTARSASALALEDTDLLVIEKTGFDKTFSVNDDYLEIFTES